MTASTSAPKTRPTTTATTAAKSLPADEPAMLKQSKSKPKQILKITVTPVQVCVRVRPVTAAEALRKDNSICVDLAPGQQTIKIQSSSGVSKQPASNGPSAPKEFTFDHVFGYEHGQSYVYETSVRPLIAKCMEGYNGCIFAYGQTASGKTFTIQGPVQPSGEQNGVVQRVAIQIMEYVDAQKKQKKDNAVETEYTLKVGFLEIYNEKLIDLLAGADAQTELKIRQEQDGSGIYVQGLTEREVGTLKELTAIHAAGIKNRTVGETNMNEASSRSHAILSLTLIEKKRDPGTERVTKKTSNIHIVDLAGSERADSTGATGQRLKEGSAINQSLSSLGNVINALTKQNGDRASHVPYRDSKLTYLLSDSLGGNSLTLMISCISPTLSNYDETVSTLRFAERVKTIKNHAKINMDPLMLRIMELENELDDIKRRAKKCTCGVMALEANDDIAMCSTLGMRSVGLWRSIKSAIGGKKVHPSGKQEIIPIDKDLPPPPPVIKASKEVR